jgi:peptidoglycan hydrolase-like protein with peptidoglycan-binding domain
MRSRARVPLLALTVALATASPAAAMGDPALAALQVGLRAHGVYSGPIDGVVGPATSLAVRALQRSTGVRPDGVAGPTTRALLGPWARHRLGSRALGVGASGWDVAAFQFLLAWHGFPSGPIDGAFGTRTARAVMRYQRWLGIPQDGVAGRATLLALRSRVPRCPADLAWPAAGAVSSLFGPRWQGFHAGVDIAAPRGTPVLAAHGGLVAWAGWRGGGWGRLVVVAGDGMRILYAHLSRVEVAVGQAVTVGDEVGRVGRSGEVTGPHLHFEVRLGGAAVDPLPTLG